MNKIKTYLWDLRSIGFSALSVYKNFFHWNLSKAVAYGYAILASLLISAIPVIGGIFLFRMIISSVDSNVLGTFLGTGEVSVDLLASFITQWWAILIIFLLFIVVVSVFLFFFAYVYFLMIRVHESYLRGEKLPIFKNSFLSWTTIKKYFSIIAWISLYLILPIIAWIISIAIIVVIQVVSGIQLSDTESYASLGIGILFLIATISSTIWFGIISIRSSFAVFSLLENQEWTGGKKAVRESFAQTKGKVFWILFRILPFFIIIWSIQFGLNLVESHFAKERSYTYLESMRTESGTGFTNDHEFLVEYYNPGITESDAMDILRAQSKNDPKTDSVGREYFEALYPYLVDTDPYEGVSDFVFFLFYFLLLESLQSMIYLAMYQKIKA